MLKKVLVATRRALLLSVTTCHRHHHLTAHRHQTTYARIGSGQAHMHFRCRSPGVCSLANLAGNYANHRRNHTFENRRRSCHHIVDPGTMLS